jgi:hypothetical protein
MFCENDSKALCTACLPEHLEHSVAGGPVFNVTVKKKAEDVLHRIHAETSTRKTMLEMLTQGVPNPNKKSSDAVSESLQELERTMMGYLRSKGEGNDKSTTTSAADRLQKEIQKSIQNLEQRPADIQNMLRALEQAKDFGAKYQIYLKLSQLKPAENEYQARLMEIILTGEPPRSGPIAEDFVSLLQDATFRSKQMIQTQCKAFVVNVSIYR